MLKDFKQTDMNRIITGPKEIVKNRKVLYAGNHFIGIPMIDCGNGSIISINVVSLINKALLELKGEHNLFEPHFFKGGRELIVERIVESKEGHYLPKLDFYLEGGIRVRGRIFTDLEEKGLLYSFESSKEIEIALLFHLNNLSFLRFNSHDMEFDKTIAFDNWLGNPIYNISSCRASLALAFGGNENFKYSYLKEDKNLELKVTCKMKNCFYISVNYDQDGASATLIHLKRKGYRAIYREFIDWLKQKTIPFPEDPMLEARLNENLFFNYFFSIARDLDSDKYLALTSRSPRYYVSGAFWERDAFLWSFPAIGLICPRLFQHLAQKMIIMHSINAGDHAHYIDGTVLYPGFELDEAASYFILIGSMKDSFVDERLIKALKKVFARIEEEFDSQTGLYRTFLLPSDDPAEYPFVLFSNVILWRGLQNFKNVLVKKNDTKEAGLVEQKIESIYKGIYRYLVKEINGKKMFLWSADGKGNFRLYNDPAGNLGTLYFYHFVNKDDPIFQNTIHYYYSSQYRYFFKDAEIGELACDHHPHTLSGIGLCGTILNPLLRDKALNWLRKADMDYGLLSESFDKNTGEAKTGVGFASGCGYLAYSLYHVLLKEKG